MHRTLLGITVGFLAITSASPVVVAQSLPEVTVQATRKANAEPRGHSPRLYEIKDISTSYAVSTAGLDLASQAGVLELERRVKEAAQAACKDIGRQHPDSLPNDAECAKQAADRAMVKVRELADAAAKKPAG